MKKIQSTLITLTIYCVIFIPSNVAAQYLQPLSKFSQKNKQINALIEKAKEGGKVRIIVGLSVEFEPEGYLGDANVIQQRKNIKSAQDLFLRKYESVRNERVIQYKYIPYLALTADLDSLENISKDPQVVSIEEDAVGKATLAESTGLVGAPTAWNINNATGAGKTIAILDTGVDYKHPFLSGKLEAEGCFSTTDVGMIGLCPDGQDESTEVGSGLDCNLSDCYHGTHVAGIAAGTNATFSGVARDSKIIAVQVFHRPSLCPGGAPVCLEYFNSDLVAGLEYIKTLSETNSNIAAVNLSLGTISNFTGTCDGTFVKPAIDNLRSVNIPTIVSSGNESDSNGMSSPSCISTAISVGSVDDGSEGTNALDISNFSNSSSELDLLAPGRWIHSSIPGTNYVSVSGTSMAAPHVAGAFAIIRQKHPNASVDDILFSLKDTGTQITDSRNNITRSLIQIPAALNSFSNPKFDFDGDNKTDVSIFRQNDPNNGEWWYRKSSDGGNVTVSFGLSTDTLVPADFTGDSITDIAYWRVHPNNTGEWFILRSEDSTFYSFPFGSSGDIPAPGDFDGDGEVDASVFRPSTGEWFILRSSDSGTTIESFGALEDKPVVADYDGDGKDDIAIYRPSNSQWWLKRSTDGVVVYQFGATGDKTVPGDYTGDGKADVAFFRPDMVANTGEWFVLRSEDASFYSIPYGISTDIPSPGDYDGDGTFDVAVFRPSTNTWFYNGSTSGNVQLNFGITGDVPIPNVYSQE